MLGWKLKISKLLILRRFPKQNMTKKKLFSEFSNWKLKINVVVLKKMQFSNLTRT